MPDLSITQQDYNRTALCADFVSKFKSFSETENHISDCHFSPKLNGYDISFSQSGVSVRISIDFKSKFSEALKIKRFDNGKLVSCFVSKSRDDNSDILNKLFCPGQKKKAQKPLGYLFLCFILIIVTYIIITAFSIVSYSHLDEAQPADAAVVLGAAAPNGKVSPVYRERINHAIYLFENGYVKYIIMTGATADGNTVSDAYAAKQYAVSQGVPETKILLEERSTITEENLKYSKIIMDEHGLDSAVIVSDPLHMKRAMLMADDYSITAFSSPTPTTMYRSLKTKIPFLLREEFFYIGYRVVRIFR